mmetsp:Transcript_20055/g.67974  ORF Transcript_20055/g.67974 Transcript_20055/m.67974 type:complete len:214 (-) Transcript_20055:83-724(-)
MEEDAQRAEAQAEDGVGAEGLVHAPQGQDVRGVLLDGEQHKPARGVDLEAVEHEGDVQRVVHPRRKRVQMLKVEDAAEREVQRVEHEEEHAHQHGEIVAHHDHVVLPHARIEAVLEVHGPNDRGERGGEEREAPCEACARHLARRRRAIPWPREGVRHGEHNEVHNRTTHAPLDQRLGLHRGGGLQHVLHKGHGGGRGGAGTPAKGRSRASQG